MNIATQAVRSVRRSGHLFAALAFLAGAVLPLVLPQSAYAYGQFSSRKLTMSSQSSGSISTDANGNAVAAGAGGNGAQAVHGFNFTIGTTGNVGSIVLQYCTSPLLDTTCVAPTGMDASTVTTIGAQTGFAGGAFALDTSTVANAGAGKIFATVPCSGVTPYRSNCILLNRTSASETAGVAKTLSFGVSGSNYIKNPTSNGTFYVRILSFSDNAYTNANAVDEAAVAGSVNNNIDITAKVQEKLNFSVASTWSTAASCAALTGGSALSLGDSNGVLDTTQAYDARSYFRLSTNASGGSTVLYSGDTLKTPSGTNVITAASSTGASSTVNAAQFGLGIDTSDANYSFTNMTATSPYGSAAGTITNAGTASFAFNTASVTSPIQIASAASGTTVTCDTGVVRYIGNIGSTTKAGVYRTTIAYIAVPTF